jgi:hypothetical protein
MDSLADVVLRGPIGEVLPELVGRNFATDSRR